MRRTDSRMRINGHIALIGIMMLIALSPLIAQEDVQYDNTAGLLPPPSWSPEAGTLIPLTDEEGFDNFLLGVDFAEPHISVNPLNPLEYFSAFNINGGHRTYDGHDWISFTPPFGGFSIAGDPVTAYDSIGTLYYESMYTVGGSIAGCKVIVSTDNGATWSAPLTAINGVDKNWIACDQTAGPFANYVYSTMTAGSGNGNFTRSTDFGATWQQTWTFAGQVLPGMMVAVGPDVMGGNNISGGCVYVVTNGGNTFSPTYSFYRSTDGGTTFQFRSSQFFANYVGTNINGRHSVQNMRTRPYPFITADNSFGPYRGRLYLIYASNTPAGNGNKPDIFCRYSDDQGLNWSAAVVINDDPNTTANHQWMPSTWCDKETGRLYVKWFDTRNVPTSDSAEVYASYSDDGGVTWAPNQKLGTSKFRIDCATCGGGGTPRYQGDYDAITSNRYAAMAVWSDFRFGNFSSFTAYFPDFAMTVSKDLDTLGTTDTTSVMVKVPAVKLYEHSVKFSATVTPAANISFNFPQGDSLVTLPDSLPLEIYLDNVAEDTYEVLIQGEGPNGTPVHRRTVTLVVTDGFVTLLQPNGGEVLFSNTNYTIRWEDVFVDSVTLEYSTDGGSNWILIDETPGKVSSNGDGVHPKLRHMIDPDPIPESTIREYDWTVPAANSSDCLVRIMDKSNSDNFDLSDNVFSIIPAPAAQWRSQTSGVAASLYSVSVLDTLVAWAGGEGGAVLMTTNGGNSWLPRISAGADIHSIFAASQVRVYAAVNDGASARIRRSFNAGGSWITAYEDTSAGAFINSVWMFDLINGYAVGDPVNGQWTLLRTTNGGTSWESAASLAQVGSETGWNNSMYWIDDQIGWFGTNNNRIYYTTDGGSSWSPATTSFANSFAVSFATDSLGMAGGNGADYSVDGGITWAATVGQIPGDVFAIGGLGVDPPRWYLASGSDIYKTSDQGNSFTLDFSQSNTVNHIDFKLVRVDDYDWICGYAVGDNGTISKYVELPAVTGIGQLTGGVPAEFELQQNYPNPFNPSTTIRFRLPVSAHVQLKVVNSLGQEVATLMDSPQNAGDVEVVWDGKNASGNRVASGIYFYQLDAKGSNGEAFKSMRKMLMIK